MTQEVGDGLIVKAVLVEPCSEGSPEIADSDGFDACPNAGESNAVFDRGQLAARAVAGKDQIIARFEAEPFDAAFKHIFKAWKQRNADTPFCFALNKPKFAVAKIHVAKPKAEHVVLPQSRIKHGQANIALEPVANGDKELLLIFERKDAILNVVELRHLKIAARVLGAKVILHRHRKDAGDDGHFTMDSGRLSFSPRVSWGVHSFGLELLKIAHLYIAYRHSFKVLH